MLDLSFASRKRIAARLIVVAVLLLVGPFRSDAQSAKVATVGVLAPSAGRNPIDIAFEQSLQDRGWVRNQNIRIETRYSAGRPDAFAPLAAELVSLGPDVLVAWTAAAAIAAKRAAGPVPVGSFL